MIVLSEKQRKNVYIKTKYWICVCVFVGVIMCVCLCVCVIVAHVCLNVPV